ncbi:VirB8/TrbF family protein [Phycisphaera mikurensis]|uniref:Putative conjugal transfer protein TrbF n=1 Tax=Phycisphaera mikurensis (strain NBRC 102666 / KCTC 22515 / FYK2301M01) TaxID=1142394 RepID=I0IJI7_PHYMF|nr:VirB8/TrbF family protein [Phycisphaera mikurensis]MBB6443175.1 type IV secretion system protein VirB5 [Phycisphaera mikurensis]BAM05425.1 putative conjugal transfer protein TrbF [Phycisphaera mikurensis NBRC 102666]
MSFPHQLFRSAKRGSLADSESPFVRAAQMTDRRMGAVRRLAIVLGVLVAGLALVVAVQAVALVGAVREKQVELYVVEVNEQGRPTRVEASSRGWNPTEAMVQRTVADLLVLMRSKPSDPVVQRRNWKRAYDFLAGDAVLTMNQLGEAREAQEVLIAVDVDSVVRLSDESLQLRWTEQVVDRGMAVSSQPWTGIFRYRLVEPTTADAAFENPLGTFVHAISWSRDTRVAVSEGAPS